MPMEMLFIKVCRKVGIRRLQQIKHWPQLMRQIRVLRSLKRKQKLHPRVKKQQRCNNRNPRVKPLKKHLLPRKEKHRQIRTLKKMLQLIQPLISLWLPMKIYNQNLYWLICPKDTAPVNP